MLIITPEKIDLTERGCDGCGEIITGPPFVVSIGKKKLMFYHVVCASHAGQKLITEAQEFAKFNHNHLSKSQSLPENLSILFEKCFDTNRGGTHHDTSE